MRIFKALALLAGMATLAMLLHRLDAGSVWEHIARSGAGLLIIFLLPIPDNLINAYGWKYSFQKEDAGRLRISNLFRARVAGDGINYLTPSATIAGEIARPMMMGDGVAMQAKIAGVAIARFTQSLGQALFIMITLMLMVWLCPPGLESLPLTRLVRRYLSFPVGIFVALVLGLGLYAAIAARKQRSAAPPPLPPDATHFQKIKREVGAYFLRHPGRFMVSILLFAAGYFLMAAEIWMIGFFMGVDITPYLALAIEAVSSAFEGVLFMIPAKLGTQEAGKTAVFKGLGLDPTQGLALGLIRHCREIAWAGLGLALYARIGKKASAG